MKIQKYNIRGTEMNKMQFSEIEEILIEKKFNVQEVFEKIADQNEFIYVSNGFIKGKPAMKAWWVDAFERLPSLQYVLVNLIVDDKQVFMEYLRKVDGEAEMMVGEVLEIEDGLIVKSRVC